MRWAALAVVAGLLLTGCGDTGASQDELNEAYEQGYAAGELDGHSDAEDLAEEEWNSGFDAGLAEGEDEASRLEDELGDRESEEVQRGLEAEATQVEVEEEAAEEAEELEDLEDEIEAEERCERYDYCYP